MSVAHLQIKDGPLFNGTPFGFTDEPVSGEIGKLSAIIFSVMKCNFVLLYFSIPNGYGRLCGVAH